MKRFNAKRSIFSGFAALAVLLGLQRAPAQEQIPVDTSRHPTTLEIGPKEIMLNALVASAANSDVYAGWPDTPIYTAYNGTSGIAYYFGVGVNNNPGHEGSAKLIGNLDNPVANTGSFPTTFYIGGFQDRVTNPQTDTYLYELTGMLAPTDSIGHNTPVVAWPFYVNPGPTYEITSGTDSGNTLMWYSAYQEEWKNTGDGGPGGGQEYNGMAVLKKGATTWIDLGEMQHSNISYDPHTSTASNAVTSEPGNVVVDPTGSYFYLYSYYATSSIRPEWETVSRASLSSVLSAEINTTTTTWYNYYQGGFTTTAPSVADGGFGGGFAENYIAALYAENSDPTTVDRNQYSWNSIVKNQYLNKYTFFGTWGPNDLTGAPIVYSDSTDGLSWAYARTIMPADFDGMNYHATVGIEEGIPNGPSWANNGESYLVYASPPSTWGLADPDAIPAIARRKIWVLDNFDNDTPGMSPSEPGWTSFTGYLPSSVATSPTSSSDHPNSLEIADSSTSHAYGLEKLYQVNDKIGGSSSSPAASMEFHAEIYPKTFGTNPIGIYLESGSNLAFAVAIFYPNSQGNYSDYTLQYYNSSGVWNIVSPAAHFSAASLLNQWHLIDVNATNTSYATVSFDHVVYGTVPSAAASPVATIDGVLINSAGVTGTGGDFYVDNVFLYPAQPSDTFENNMVSPATIPNGWNQVSANDANATALITTDGAYTGVYVNPEGPGSQSMEITDNSTTNYLQVAKIVDPTASKWLEAQIYPKSFGTTGCFSGILFGSGTGAGSYVYNIGIMAPSSPIGNYSDYTLQYYNGATWGLVGGASAHLGTTNILNQWHQIDVDATSTTSATIYFGTTAGTLPLIGTISNWGTSPTIDRAEFYTGSSTGIGFDEYVDNVYFGPALLNDNDFAFDVAENNTAPSTPSLPWGYSVVAGTAPTVTDIALGSVTAGYDGPNALHVYDTNTPASVEKVVAASTPSPGHTLKGKSIDFEIYPHTIGDAIYIDLDDGPPVAGNSNTVCRLGIFFDTASTAELKYELSNGTWSSPLAGNGTGPADVNINAWNEIDLNDSNADSTAANLINVYLNGHQSAIPYYNTGASNWHSALTIDRVVFSCASTGDDFYIDDVVFN